MLFGLVVVGGSAKRWRWLWLTFTVPIALLLLQLHHVWGMLGLWAAGAATAYLFQRVRFGLTTGIILALSAMIAASGIRLAIDIDKQSDVLLTKVTMGAAFAAIVLALGARALPITRRAAETGFTSKIAGYSYSLYLTHVIFLAILDMAFGQEINLMRQNIGYAGTALALLLAINVAAYGFSWVSEQHNDTVRRWLLRDRRRPKPAAGAAVAPS
jgi:peptidoglycan/LPS O-acetylase OafA/YrhL